MTRRRTFHRRGSRTIRTLTNPLANVRSTAILGVTLSGAKIKPFIIFKGTTDGRIARQISNKQLDLPDELEYGVQKNAWTDEPVMLDYIEKVNYTFTDILDHKALCTTANWSSTDYIGYIFCA